MKKLSLTPVLQSYKIIIDFHNFNLEYPTENFVLMILEDMLGYKLVETVHLSGWFPKKLNRS